MKTPKSFRGWFGVLNISMTIVVVLYVMMGFFGYWRYEDNIRSSISLNLPGEEW